MKYFFFVAIFAFASQSFGQVVNPRVIYQDTDIALHNTNVYYCPFAPPSDSDTRVKLSCIAQMDSDGIMGGYYPITRDTQLNLCHPCGDSIGDTIGNQVPWQRLFTAMDKPSGAHSDIIAGGDTGERVIISKNEDVDFRATGRITLKSGFHVMPGAFFHAYTAPTRDTLVFSDEFNDSATFHNNWLVFNNTWAGPAQMQDCSYDSNVVLDTDYEAEDGHALRIDLKEDSCYCAAYGKTHSACELDSANDTIKHYVFSTALIQSCPFPFSGGVDPVSPSYQESPYGIYEVREKVPIIEHHTNNYGGGQGNEWNLGEKLNGGLTEVHPGFTRRYLYGPFRGRFGRLTIRGIDNTVFYSSAAHFCLWNSPSVLSINGFPYEVQIDRDTLPGDTVLIANATTVHEGGFPSSLIADSTDSVTFYYYKNAANNISDLVPWSVDPTGRYLSYPSRDSAAYGLDGHGDTLYFNKSYQPTDISLVDTISPFFTKVIKYSCHWDHHTGKILLTDTMAASASHSGTGFTYDCDEGPEYAVPPIAVDTSTYKYHTYTMELFPHEARFLVDGAVRQRFPDRLIPPTDPRYDYVTGAPRAPMNIQPGEIDMDVDSAHFAMEKAYFEAHSSDCPGCWTDSHGQHIASHRIDYVKVWQLPNDVVVPKFPQ